MPPVHTAAGVTGWTAARQIQVIQHLPYLLDLDPADFL
jgi:hypothetical protein